MSSHRLHNILKLFAPILLLCHIGTEAGAQTDSLYLHLDSTTFTIRRHASAIKKSSDGVTSINADMIQSLPQIFGNTDPVNFIRQLPGVQTNSEYDSGIHIQGCDNSHNLISIGNVPVFGSNHLFGLFSVFIPSHHESMTFSPSAHRANRLGGMLNMELPDTLKKNVTGDISVGMMSSQGTIGVRAGNKSHLRVSARSSYINTFYKRWMYVSGSPVRYSFTDLNLTWLYADGRDRVWADFYFGTDKASVAEKHFDVGLDVRWGNALGAVHWERNGSRLRQRHSAYYSGYLSDSHVTQSSSLMDLTSFINALGYKSTAQWKDFTAGADLTYYHIQPQSPMLSGIIGAEGRIRERQNSGEMSLFTEYDKKFASDWNIKAGLKASAYISPESRLYAGLSPSASISYDFFRYGKIKASYNLGRQYLFQTGVSNIGLPVEFWLAAGKYSRPQHSHDFSLSYDAAFFSDALAISVSTYYKKLYNQIQYTGSLFDFFSNIYDLDRHLLKGKGWNYGLNLMVHKQTGNLTGWISYSLGRALRQFDNPDYPDIYPANHERIHELNAVASYRMGKWNFGGTFVYASGMPFTAPEHFYLSSGQILTVYGKHNGCRMRPYMRMDLSVTYSFIRNLNQENGINISIYNVLGRHNDIMYRIVQNEQGYSYSPVSFFLQFMPSISYFHKF